VNGVASSGLLARRAAGVLAHPTSLPGPRARGELGAEALRFVDWLAACGARIWQMLPLGPTHTERSPYHCQSALAGDPRLIDLEWLHDRGWLASDRAAPDDAARAACLQAARAGYHRRADAAERDGYAAFVAAEHEWLEDWSLYTALKTHQLQAPWWRWPAPLRDREPGALRAAGEELAEAVETARFAQYIFHRQWRELRAHAARRGVRLLGDLPIFVAQDSADVWAERGAFLLGADGRPAQVAGVPPDFFSATGQRWGNPLYDWERMKADGYHWWVRRMRTELARFDMVRIDHFRGFQAFWMIPADQPTAVNGRWVEGPGEALFAALAAELGPLPVIAEDLGMITPEVHALRERLGFPGMRVLQFGFDGNADNPHLPHNHIPGAVVYTGTHDNDTGLGWYRSLDDRIRSRVDEYLGAGEAPWTLLHAAYTSVAYLAIAPLQDLLALGSEARMNTPGTTEGNWGWRFRWEDLPDALPGRLARLAALTGRG